MTHQITVQFDGSSSGNFIHFNGIMTAYKIVVGATE